MTFLHCRPELLMGIQILTQTLSSAEIASLSLLRTSHYCKSSHPKQGQNKSNLHILTATRVSQRMSSKEFIKTFHLHIWSRFLVLHRYVYSDVTLTPTDGRWRISCKWLKALRKASQSFRPLKWQANLLTNNMGQMCNILNEDGRLFATNSLTYSNGNAHVY